MYGRGSPAPESRSPCAPKAFTAVRSAPVELVHASGGHSIIAHVQTIPLAAAHAVRRWPLTFGEAVKRTAPRKTQLPRGSNGPSQKSVNPSRAAPKAQGRMGCASHPSGRRFLVIPLGRSAEACASRSTG